MPSKPKSVSAAIFWNSCKPFPIDIKARPASISAGDVTYNAAICSGPKENELAIASNITSMLVIALPPPIPKNPFVLAPLSPNKPLPENISAIGNLFNSATPFAITIVAAPAIIIAPAPSTIKGAANPATPIETPKPTIMAPIIPTVSHVAPLRAINIILTPSAIGNNASPATAIANDPSAMATGIGPAPAIPNAKAKPTMTAPAIPISSQLEPLTALNIAAVPSAIKNIAPAANIMAIEPFLINLAARPATAITIPIPAITASTLNEVKTSSPSKSPKTNFITKIAIANPKMAIAA